MITRDRSDPRSRCTSRRSARPDRAAAAGASLERVPPRPSGRSSCPERILHDRAAGALAMVSRTPFVFPSLSPQRFCSSSRRRAPAASPRHTIYGHAIGILRLRRALALRAASRTAGDGRRASRAARAGAALSLASTGALMILLKATHPPAGATTLIISLGMSRAFYCS